MHWAGNARTDSGGRYLTSYLTTSMGYLSGRPIIQCAFAAGVTAALQVRSTETAYSHTALASVCCPVRISCLMHVMPPPFMTG